MAVAAGGYRFTPSKRELDPILFRLRELNLVEWEHRRAERSTNLLGFPKRLIRLTEKGQQVAEAILKLAALLREAESF